MRLVAPALAWTLSALLIAAPAFAEAGDTLQIKCEDKGTAGLSVQVLDGTGAPVSEAAVALRLSDEGPTGSFADGTRAAVAYTGESGTATVGVVRWSTDPGTATLRITATRGALHGSLVVPHTVLSSAAVEKHSPPQPGVPQPKAVSAPPTQIAAAEPPPHISVTAPPADERIHGGGKMKWILLAVLAAGAGAGVAVMTKSKQSSSSSSTSSTGITIGTPTVSVGAP